MCVCGLFEVIKHISSRLYVYELTFVHQNKIDTAECMHENLPGYSLNGCPGAKERKHC